MLRYLLRGTILGLVLLQAPVGPAETVTLDGGGPGRTFEGLGGLSAGASSRLLLDYPEPQRSQILDFLFRPNFGAALHHLKVEIGGDVNSTWGDEPSHARTREEFEHPRPEYFDRGYEWWLMCEAKKRNPRIYLDALQWGAPGWIGDKDVPDAGDPNTLSWKERKPRNRKKFYTQDNADFIVGFIQGAKKHHGLDIDFCGVWNETPYDVPWIKLLRKTLDSRSLSRVKIVAADQVTTWDIADLLNRDAALKEAVHAVGVHYPGGIYAWNLGVRPPTSSAAAKECGRLLWSSEDGPWRGDWVGARSVAKFVNRNYIDGRMTKTILCSLITSYYDNLVLPKSGPMMANTPWSGCYELQPVLWALAHTAQFAQPGWKYLDNACGLLKDGGSYVSLRSPEAAGDYSIIVETIDAKKPQTLSIRTAGGLAAGPLHVWRSNHQKQFDRRNDIPLTDGVCAVSLEPDCIYSLTTTTGQQKGKAEIPPPADFPLPYRDDFEGSLPGKLPRYFSDQSGAFEVARRPDGGRCLRQIITRRGIDWHYSTPIPRTIIGATEWRDCEVRCDVYVEKSGHASLFGHILTSERTMELPHGYRLMASTDGRWELNAFTRTLAAGTVSFAADRWHTLALKFVGPKIVASIDGVEVTTTEDSSYPAGMAGVGSGWNNALFDNFSVQPGEVCKY